MTFWAPQSQTVSVRSESESSSLSTEVVDDVGEEVEPETILSLKAWATASLVNFYSIGRLYDLPCVTCNKTVQHQICQDANGRQAVYQCCLTCGESEPLYSAAMYKWQQKFYLEILK